MKPLVLLLSLAFTSISPAFAAQTLRDKNTPDSKRVAEMVATLKKGLEDGTALHLVLARLGGDYTAALVQLLDDPKVDRTAVLGSLSYPVGDSAIVIPALVKVLQKEERSWIRQAAVKLLWKHQQFAVPALLDILKVAKESDMDKNIGVRSAALWALGNLDVNMPGRDAHDIVKALEPATKHKAADVRVAAVASVGRIQVRDAQARLLPHPGLPLLLAAVKDDDAKVRELAAKALGDTRGVPGENQKIIPAMLELALSDYQDSATGAPRWEAIHALAFMGDQGIKPLMDASWGGGHRHEAIKAAFVQALGKTKYKSPLALPYLLDNIDDQHVMHTLAQLNYGEAAEKAIPTLTANLGSPRGYQRFWALEALFTVGPKGPLAVAVALKDQESPVREAILNRLRKAKFTAKEGVPSFIACLEDKSPQVRALAAEALGAIGPDARAAIPALDIAVDDRDATVRACAQDALKRIKR